MFLQVYHFNNILEIQHCKNFRNQRNWNLPKKKNSQGRNSYTLLLLNLISLQIKVYFELIDISEYQFSAYLHLLLLLLTLKDSI